MQDKKESRLFQNRAYIYLGKMYEKPVLIKAGKMSRLPVRYIKALISREFKQILRNVRCNTSVPHYNIGRIFMLKLTPLYILILGVSLALGITLQEAYQNASPGLGYDRLVLLNPDSIYTGGLNIVDEKVGIKGFGAIIDLNNDSISVTGQSIIDLDGCVIINGAAGLYLDGPVVSRVSQCTFYGNQYGILIKSGDASIVVYNTILAHQFRYGFACQKSTQRILYYLDAFQNTQGNYVEWCPG